MSSELKCRACEHRDVEASDLDELGLCVLCHEVNNLATEFGYDEIRRVIPMLQELGSRESEEFGETQIA